MTLLSKRKYRVLMVENGSTSTRETFDVYQLTGRDTKSMYEYMYALQEIGDKVLDLKIGESIYFQPNRDNNEAKGILIRVD